MFQNSGQNTSKAEIASKLERAGNIPQEIMKKRAAIYLIL